MLSKGPQTAVVSRPTMLSKGPATAVASVSRPTMLSKGASNSNFNVQVLCFQRGTKQQL